MISYLNGKIILKRDKFIIVEVNGIGYKVFLNNKTLLTLSEMGETINPHTKQVQGAVGGVNYDGFCSGVGVKLFVFQNVKEEVLDLYGFLTYEELEFFEILMDIRGVGPKSALDIAALGSLDRIKDRILQQDEKIFAGIPGIGSKKAMTIILELTGKINILGSKKGSTDEAEGTLIQLGFSKQQAKDTLSRISEKDPEERVKQALKILGK